MNLPEFLTPHSHGEIRLAGHRIGLEHVVALYREGYSPEMLHEQYPTLSLALIHKVIAKPFTLREICNFVAETLDSHAKSATAA